MVALATPAFAGVDAYAQDMTEQNDPPPDSKLTRSKERWAREGRFLTGKTARADEQRLPPGQH